MTRTRIIASLIGLGWLTPVWGQAGSGSISPELQALLVGLGAGGVGVGLLGWWVWFRLRQGRPAQKAAAGLVVQPISLPLTKQATKAPEKEALPAKPAQETRQERNKRLEAERAEKIRQEREEKAAKEQARKQAEAEKTRKEHEEKEAQKQAKKQAKAEKERGKQTKEAEAAAKQREVEKARAAAEAERKRQQAEQEAQQARDEAARQEAEKKRAETEAGEQAARERAEAEARQKEAEAQAAREREEAEAREREEAEQERSRAVSPPLHEAAGRVEMPVVSDPEQRSVSKGEPGPGGEAKQPEVVAVKYAESPADNGFAQAELHDSEGGIFKLTLYSNETATFEVLNNSGIRMLIDLRSSVFATVCEIKTGNLSQQQPGLLRKNGSYWECVQKNIIG